MNDCYQLLVHSLFHSTVPAEQQTTETCDALDQMIANRNIEFAGHCTRNDLCTNVTCLSYTNLKKS